MNAMRLVAGVADIEHQNPPVHVDLARRKTDTLGGIHGLQQIVDQLTHRVINRRHGHGLGPQARVWILQNCELCHGSYEMDIVFSAEDCC